MLLFPLFIFDILSSFGIIVKLVSKLSIMSWHVKEHVEDSMLPYIDYMYKHKEIKLETHV